ncbi:MAG: hypothetical protein JXA14_26205 [Anaerolineae bacterium]|nr:hypothetical protein [Anaerolineae bacterium]
MDAVEFASRLASVPPLHLAAVGLFAELKRRRWTWRAAILVERQAEILAALKALDEHVHHVERTVERCKSVRAIPSHPPAGF